MQSAFQEKFRYTMAVQGMLGGGSVMVRWRRDFAVAAVFDNSSAASLPGMPWDSDEVGVAFLVAGE